MEQIENDKNNKSNNFITQIVKPLLSDLQPTESQKIIIKSILAVKNILSVGP